MIPLDKQIQDEIQTLCLTDFEKFKELYLDMNKLKICKQRAMGKTLQQIAKAMQMPKRTVANQCAVCP